MSRSKKQLALLLGLFVAACTAVKPLGFIGKEDGFKMKVEEDRICLPVGGVNRLKLRIARSEYFHNRPIWIGIQTDLPTGVSARVTTNPVLGDTTTVVISASAAAAAVNKMIVISGDAKAIGYPRKGTLVRMVVRENQQSATGN